MNSTSPSSVAEAWIDNWSTEDPSETELDFELPRHDPALCLKVIVEIISRIPADPENKHFQVLAAGPLEELLVTNGEKVLEEVDSLCRKSPEFRLLLNGTWMSGARAKVSERLEKYRKAAW